MASSYSYRKVHDVDIEGDSEIHNVEAAFKASPNEESFSSRLSEQTVWFRRPSIFWLLPVFLLFNLAMGATAMPRMNVLISLICRHVLSNNTTVTPKATTRGFTQNNFPRHMAMASQSGHSMDSTTSAAGMGNYSATAVVIGEHNPQCSIKEVESATAMLTLYGNLIAGILGAIITPFWGKLSDRYGRVRPLAAASAIFLGGEIVSVLIAALPDAFPLNWIYLAYLLEGLSGSFVLIMALASSYAVDCTPDNERNVALGWFHGSMFFGMAAGPIFGGYLGMIDGKSRPLLIFYTALAMRVIGIAFLLLFVPESLPHPQMRVESTMFELKQFFGTGSRESWTEKFKSANPFRLLQILMPTKSTAGKDVQRNLIALASVNTIMFASVIGAMNVMMLYSEFIFGWGNKESGVFLSAINFSRTIATIVVLPLVIRLFRRWFSPARQPLSSTDRGFDRLDLFLIRTSIFSDIIGYLGYALAPTGALFIISGVIASLGAIGLATSEASMTKLVDSSQTGELLGALGFLQAMARIVAPTVANLTYSRTVDSVPQLVFLGIAACFFAAGVASVFARPAGFGGALASKESEESEQMVPLQAQN